MIIECTVGNNLKRERRLVEDTETLKSVLESAEVDYSRGTMHLDGATLAPGDLDKTFAQLGIREKCFLLNVVKADNA